MYRPERTMSAAIIGRQTGGRLVCDPRADLPPSPEGTWRTARHAWNAGLESGGTHVAVIQDDVRPCPHFPEVAAHAVAAKPEDAITFYANRKPCEEAAARGDHWAFLGTSWLMGQAFCLPTSLVASLVEHGDSLDGRFTDFRTCEDFRYQDFLRATKRGVWATVPSLVEHASPAASLIGYSNSNRTARVPWARYPDLLGITW